MTTAPDRTVSRQDLDDFVRPFPALTAAQRLHFDLLGYVVLENTLTAAEVAELRAAILGLEERVHSGHVDGLEPAFFSGRSHQYFRVDNLPHLGACFFDYLTHPRLVGCAEEVIGSEARLEQSDAHIRRPAADGQDGYDFHRGWESPGKVANGLYHCAFVKTLTNLTDLGPDDGGTAVIPGTHRLGADVDVREVIRAAMADPRLVHQVVAPAGSTLLFAETLVHSTGIIRSGRERMLIIGGYTPPYFQPWTGYEPSPHLLERLPQPYREFLDGTRNYAAHPRHRARLILP